MTSDFSVDMNEYLPLRDVVFNTLRQAILKGELDRKSTRLNSSHREKSRMPSSA